MWKNADGVVKAGYSIRGLTRDINLVRYAALYL